MSAQHALGTVPNLLDPCSDATFGPGVERGYERLTGALHTAGELERDWIVARAAEWKGEDMGSQSALIRSSNKRGGGNGLEVAGRKVRGDLPQIGPTLIIKDQAL